MMESPEARDAEAPPWAAGAAERMSELDPELDEAQIGIVRRYGEERRFADGELLWDIGQDGADFFVVLEGAVEIVRRDQEGEHVIITHRRGHYGGETVTMSGRAPLVFGRAFGATRAVAVEPQNLRALIATEPVLGEIIFRSFILRRMRMVAEHHGDIVIVGSDAYAGTGQLRSFLSRNGIPHDFAEVGSELQERLFEQRGLQEEDLPVVLCGREVLRQPCNREIAECLGFATPLEDEQEADVVIVGAGAGGLAAATYAASEGLSAVVLEAVAPGGQAATSSKIENYLGFPTGISGQALMGRGFLQSQKFGALVAVARRVETIECGTPRHTVTLDGGTRLRARSIVVASGAEYREPPIEGMQEYLGSNVHYAASHLEGQMCRRKQVAVIGGGNSAGQAAVFLSGQARKVYVVIRSGGLEHSMSSYLIDRIDNTENIELLPHTEVQSLHGDAGLDHAIVLDNRTGETRPLEVGHVFVFIGAKPATEFLPERVLLDEREFVRTGGDLSTADLESVSWPLSRQPYLLETSCPRIFAVGDVRSGSVKRVASAVGEGSVSVQFVHRALAEEADP
ncbi:MAG: FAD-dependent oxidoreductase [Acidobacteriota bacterium]